MAEFCLKCFNEVFEKNFSKRQVILEWDFCEGCGQWKNCVVVVKRDGFFRRFVKVISGKISWRQLFKGKSEAALGVRLSREQMHALYIKMFGEDGEEQGQNEQENLTENQNQ